MESSEFTAGLESEEAGGPEPPRSEVMGPAHRAIVEADETLGLFYQMEQERCLNSFITEDPDINGWNNVLGLMASEVELVPGSLGNTDEGVTCLFRIPGTNVEIECAIDDAGRGRIRYMGTADVPGAGHADVVSTTIFHDVDGVVSEAQGTIQFKTLNGQPFREPGPAGCVYATDERKTHYRPISWEKSEGKTWLVVPPEAEAKEQPTSGLGWAYDWMSRLNAARASATETR